MGTKVSRLISEVDEQQADPAWQRRGPASAVMAATMEDDAAVRLIASA